MKTLYTLLACLLCSVSQAQMTVTVDTALTEVPVNIFPLTDSTDFASVEDGVAYNATGMTLFWHFTTTAGATTVTAVTPTTSGDYDWSEGGTDTTAGMYYIEIPASGGASINNDTEGFGHFTGRADGVLPWRGPIITFTPANVSNAMVNGSDLLMVDVDAVDNSTAAATALEEGLNASGVYQVLYVDPNVSGGDSDARDKANADADTNSALALIDGDIGGLIYRSAGTETGNTVVSKSNVTIQGVAGAIYDATSGASMSVQEDNVTLIGLELDDLTVGTVTGTRLIQCTITGTITGSANIDIQDCTINGTYYPSISLLADAIKDKTDSLTFTVAGELDANVLSVEGVDATDALEQTANDGLVDNSYLETQLAAILVADIDDTAGSIGKVLADTLARSPSSAAITNINTVFETDFATAYNATLDRWNSNLLSVEGTAPSAGGLLDAADIEAAADAAIATYFGTAGSGLTGIPWNASWDAEVESEVDDALQTDITAIKGVTDKLDTGLEADGATGYQWTTLALENGTGGTGDWTPNEKTEIKTVLGITDTGTPDDTPSAGALFAMQGATFNSGTDSLEVIANVMNNIGSTLSTGFDALPTAGEIEAEVLPYFQLLARSDAAIKTDRGTQLTLLNQDQGSGAGSYDSATESAQAIRDRGDAAWDTATGFSTLDASAVQTAATAALDAYDPPTKAEMDTGFSSTLQLHTSYNFTNGSGADAGATFQIRTP